MYKADIKEPDSSLPPRCPRCNADGLQVGSTTLKAHLASEAAESLGEPAYWCATNDCPVAYFDLFERSVDCKASHGLYWPKVRPGRYAAATALRQTRSTLTLPSRFPPGSGRWCRRRACRMPPARPRALTAARVSPACSGTTFGQRKGTVPFNCPKTFRCFCQRVT